jgi:hypothetical protein
VDTVEMSFKPGRGHFELLLSAAGPPRITRPPPPPTR